MTGRAEDVNVQGKFNVEETQGIIFEAIESCLGNEAYNPSKVKQWTNDVVQKCISQLTKTSKNFKYVVTCTLMQKTGAGIYSLTKCYWDDTTDGTCSVHWDNQTIYCIVTVFGVAL
ncbi:unnamed protein product [Darwinula stevensoni]|uniref:Dynein light chain Tctex-type 1 n=1 Tax=Darwinula stevensoni TaxID=69355 RepID=A0A7R8X6L7_9CRUS|nr:unnamed protein product [Darwinula stevensoni]CAG0882240.1 unnamed protein product [Darwinula stevensoni]